VRHGIGTFTMSSIPQKHLQHLHRCSIARGRDVQPPLPSQDVITIRASIAPPQHNELSRGGCRHHDTSSYLVLGVRADLVRLVRAKHKALYI
jgi:hypothetical protein